MVLDGAMGHLLNRVISANSSFCRGFSQGERGFQSSKQIGALPRPRWAQFLESGRGCTANQSNRFRCGGARLYGNTTGSANAAFLSRWVSILSMTRGPSIQARACPVSAANAQRGPRSALAIGYDFDRTATPGADFYVDIENPLQSLSPTHRCPALRW